MMLMIWVNCLEEEIINWTIQNSEIVGGGVNAGYDISVPGYNDSSWIPTTVPSTVMASLIANGYYGDVFYNMNLSTIDAAQFSGGWWYRAEFNSPTSSQRLDDSGLPSFDELYFEGINYKAMIFLNGKLLGKAVG